MLTMMIAIEKWGDITMTYKVTNKGLALEVGLAIA